MGELKPLSAVSLCKRDRAGKPMLRLLQNLLEAVKGMSYPAHPVGLAGVLAPTTSSCPSYSFLPFPLPRSEMKHYV